MYLTQSLHRSLQQNPDRPATIYRNRVRTVAESVDRIARLAAALSDLGVQRRRPGGHPLPELRPLSGVLLRGAVDGSRGQPGEHPVECR